MNFGYSVQGLINGRKVTISVWDRKTCVRLSAEEREKIREIVDTFGWNSAQAQGLKRPVTDYNRLKSSDQRLYLICKPHWVRGARVIGGLKCGKKHLYFSRDDGYEECEPLCVLDFYIHERYQRKGIGKRLFKSFLEAENEQPFTIAYDRPSQKLLNFLKKYYGGFQLASTRFVQQSLSLPCSSPGVSRHVHQNNNFFVFDTFFDKTQLFKVKSIDKKIGYLPKGPTSAPGRYSSRNRESSTPPRPSLTPPRSSLTPPRDNQKSTTTASSSIISRYSTFQKSRTSTVSVDSNGKPKERFDHFSRPPIRPMRPVAQRMTMHPSETTLLTRIPTGPYPGWQPLEHGPRIQKPKKKESVGLTRLSPIHNISHQQPMTPSCRCIPPWATGLSADRTTGIVKKIVTVSTVSSRNSPTCEASSAMYAKYKGRNLHANDAKNCLQWTSTLT